MAWNKFALLIEKLMVVQNWKSSHATFFWIKRTDWKRGMEPATAPESHRIIGLVHKLLLGVALHNSKQWIMLRPRKHMCLALWREHCPWAPPGTYWKSFRVHPSNCTKPESGLWTSSSRAEACFHDAILPVSHPIYLKLVLLPVSLWEKHL